MPINVGEEIQNFIRSLLTDRGFAAQYAEDPRGMLAAQGVTDHDLSGVDMPGAVGAVCGDPSVAPETRSALQSYTGGGAGPAHSAANHSVEQVVQHLNYVTYQTYEGDDYITNMIDQSVDNSVDVDVDGNVFGDVDVDAVTGEQGQIIDGDNFGQANTGDGAVQAGDDASGVNTGVNTGINAGDDVENAVVGDGNETAQVSGSADGSAFGFGDGDVNNLPNADIDDSSVSFGGGDATNVSGNTVDDGSAIAVGGDASGSNVEDNDTFEDNDTTVTTSFEDNDTTVNDNDTHVEDNDTTVVAVQDNDTIESGDDTEFANQ
ncbi:hypothetical protein [Actinophytocola oryzae]|uniref:Uncharacterized protein n=1 Tax=Actinophytocola oryzae TaxID=502181 RepID=A0A4R7W514_9PSEU|nr:hypothetical protein [Actinophytocola oryzae]TDV57305.1 hypothetical protein CLV71_101176 [Actinophytocola oryzae]